jgi:hypothetical protein
VTDERLPLRLHHLGDVHAYVVTGDELDLIESAAKTIADEFAFASVCASTTLALVIALTSGGMTSVPVRSAYLAISVATGILTVVFVRQWLRNRGAVEKLMIRIRQRREDPFGAQGREILRDDLQQLPGVAPTTMPPENGQ